jgi:hypothetical protein
MKRNLIFILLILFVAIVSCTKNEPPQLPADVYISGDLYYENDSAVTGQAAYWKNGQLVKLQNDGRTTAATDIFVSGSDVYVSGYISYGRTSAPVYWKNGVLNILPMQNPAAIKNGIAKKIMVVDNVVYVAGAEYYSGDYVMKIWQDGVGLNLSEIGNKSIPYDMDIRNGKVYVVGYQKDPDEPQIILDNFWIFNVSQPRIGNNMTIINGIKVVGNDIYTVGIDNSLTACFINGTRQTIFTTAEMKDIAVINNDRYVSGIYQNKAACWINDSLINLSSPFLTESSANSIALNGSDVYIVGYEKLATGRKKARYWVNQQSSITLNDSSSIESIANSIFVVNQ